MEQEIDEAEYQAVLSMEGDLTEIVIPMGVGTLMIHRKPGMGNTEFFLKKADIPTGMRFYLWQKQ